MGNDTAFLGCAIKFSNRSDRIEQCKKLKKMFKKEKNRKDTIINIIIDTVIDIAKIKNRLNTSLKVCSLLSECCYFFPIVLKNNREQSKKCFDTYNEYFTQLMILATPVILFVLYKILPISIFLNFNSIILYICSIMYICSLIVYNRIHNDFSSEKSFSKKYFALCLFLWVAIICIFQFRLGSEYLALIITTLLMALFVGLASKWDILAKIISIAIFSVSYAQYLFC